jgi:transcriptional regulator with XRE-family HTH domain
VDTIKEIRRRKGWSQKDLAEESGVGQDTISGIESGRHEPRPSTLRKLADALDVEVADFFREPAVPLADALPPSGPLNKDEILDVVHDVILRQETETQQAANRAIWSQRMQDSYVRPENELMARLRETKRDVVDEALVETMRELVHRELAQQERERAQISEEPTAPPEPTRTTDS